MDRPKFGLVKIILGILFIVFGYNFTHNKSRLSRICSTDTSRFYIHCYRYI